MYVYSGIENIKVYITNICIFDQKNISLLLNVEKRGHQYTFLLHVTKRDEVATHVCEYELEIYFIMCVHIMHIKYNSNILCSLIDCVYIISAWKAKYE